MVIGIAAYRYSFLWTADNRAGLLWVVVIILGSGILVFLTLRKVAPAKPGDRDERRFR